MKKKLLPKVTIGIPAYNEEANIAYLLKDLLKQETSTFKLSQIVVSSDGSIDNTVRNARKVKSKKVKILDHNSRNGCSVRQNEILENTNSDILVLVNADTLIKDKRFVEKIIRPIVLGQSDLTSVRVEELPAENYIEKTLDLSMKIKKNIYENLNEGNNLYTCHGRARAFSKRFYKQLKFKSSVAEDAYAYLCCISKGFKYQLVKNTQIFYKLPTNFSDHKKQSLRFLDSKDWLSKEFGKEFIDKNYELPIRLVFVSILSQVLAKPIESMVYLFIFWLMRTISLFTKIQNTWEIAQSSKVLR